MSYRNFLGEGIAALLLASALVGGCQRNTPDSMVASAKQYLADGDHKSAAIQLKNALQQDPKLAEARFLLGQAMLRTGDAAGAEIELRKALELGYPLAQVNPALARALVTRGQHRKAIDEFANVEAATPEGTAMLHTAIGEAQMALRVVDAADASFEKALAAVPGYPPALLGSARVKAGRRDLAGALAIVDDALKSSPKLVEAHQFKGDLQIALGKPDAALVAYREAIQVKASHVPAHVAIVGVLMRQGKLDEAGKQLDAMKQVAPKHPHTAYLRALFSYRQKDLVAARDSILQQLRLAPDNIPGLVLAGAIEQDLKSYAQSEAHLQKALQKAPNYLPAQHLLVSGYLRSGQPAKALESMTPLLASGSENPTTLALAGEVYLTNGRPAEAARHFEKASALDPQDGRKKTGLALSHLAQGDVDQGLRELEEAAAGSSDARADLALIAAHLQKRQFDQALAAIDSLDKKRPDHALNYNLRGVALMGKRDEAGARKSFERALALDQAFLPAAANLAKLDLADKKPQEARKRFEAVLAKDPKNAQAMLALAELQRRNRGKPEEVAAMIRKAVAANPTDPAARLALINHYLRSRDPAKAVVAAQEALVAMPDRPELLDAAGRAQLAAGSSNQALATYGKWSQLQPKAPLPLLRMAEAQIASKDIASAERSLRKALELKPDFLDAQRRLIALDVQRDRLPQALAMAQTVQKQRPNESAGYVLEGNIHAHKKAWTPAIAVYRAGLKKVDASELAIRLHAALRTSGQGSEAERFAAARLKQHPQELAFRAYMAESALVAEDFPASIEHYQALLAMQPDNASWLNNLAWAAGRAKDPKAIEYAEKADSLRPNDPAIMDTLGMLLVDKGDMARGLDLLRKASSAAPDTPRIRLNLAKSLIKAGQKDAAKKELDDLAKLGEKFPAQAEVGRLIREL